MFCCCGGGTTAPKAASDGRPVRVRAGAQVTRRDGAAGYEKCPAPCSSYVFLVVTAARAAALGKTVLRGFWREGLRQL